MAKNKITSRFRLVSMGAVLLCALLSKILLVTYRWADKDVLVPDIAASILLRGYELCNVLTISLVICFTVYAHAYFGTRTCISVSLVSLGGLFASKVFMFIYNCIANELTAAQLISGALAYVVEVLFDALLIIIAIILSYSFAKNRCLSGTPSPERAFSPEKCCIAVSGAYYFIQIADLTAMHVIPFIANYGAPTKSELMTMISDYVFYLVCFGISVLFIYLSFILIRKLTGKLVLKKYYKV